MSVVFTLLTCVAFSAVSTAWLIRAITAVGVPAAAVDPVAVWRSAMTGLALLVLTVPAEVSTFVPLLVFAGVSVVVAHVDLACRRIPDSVCLTAYPVMGATMIVFGIAHGDANGLLCAAVAAAVHFCCYLGFFVHGGVGFGDVKLAGLIGLVSGWVGPHTAVWALVLGFVVGGVVGAWWVVRRRREATMAFAPPMLIGSFLAIALTGVG